MHCKTLQIHFTTSGYRGEENIDKAFNYLLWYLKYKLASTSNRLLLALDKLASTSKSKIYTFTLLKEKNCNLENSLGKKNGMILGDLSTKLDHKGRKTDVVDGSQKRE